MFLNLVKKRPQFRLAEFLHGQDGLVKDQSGDTYFTNQIILSFYHQDRLAKAQNQA